MQWLVSRMPAFFLQILCGLVLHSRLNNLGLLGMVFAEVRAKPTLSVLNM